MSASPIRPPETPRSKPGGLLAGLFLLLIASAVVVFLGVARLIELEGSALKVVAGLLVLETVAVALVVFSTAQAAGPDRSLAKPRFDDEAETILATRPPVQIDTTIPTRFDEKAETLPMADLAPRLKPTKPAGVVDEKAETIPIVDPGKS